MPTLRQFLEAHRAEIQPRIYNIKAYSPPTQDDMFAKVVEQVVAIASSERGRGIVACDPRSVIEAVKRAAGWPCDIGGDTGSALIVSEQKAEGTSAPMCVAMQTARAKLAILGHLRQLEWHNARVVYEGEAFDSEQGETPRIVKHQDLTMYPQKRKRVLGVYVLGLRKAGLPFSLEQMNRADLDVVRTEWSREMRDGELEDHDKFAAYAIAKCVHRFVANLALPLNIRALLDDHAPTAHSVEPQMLGVPAGTITVPVADPRSICESVTKPVGPENRRIVEGEQPEPRSIEQAPHRVRREMSRL